MSETNEKEKLIGELKQYLELKKKFNICCRDAYSHISFEQFLNLIELGFDYTIKEGTYNENKTWHYNIKIDGHTLFYYVSDNDRVPDFNEIDKKIKEAEKVVRCYE